MLERWWDRSEEEWCSAGGDDECFEVGGSIFGLAGKHRCFEPDVCSYSTECRAD